jgi:hypothetical protein
VDLDGESNGDQHDDEGGKVLWTDDEHDDEDDDRHAHRHDHQQGVHPQPRNYQFPLHVKQESGANELNAFTRFLLVTPRVNFILSTGIKSSEIPNSHLKIKIKQRI